jgi:hypothetical protein
LEPVLDIPNKFMEKEKRIQMIQEFKEKESKKGTYIMHFSS